MTEEFPMPMTTQGLAAEIVRRDRRRIRALAALTIGLWLLAGLLIPSVYLPLGGKLREFGKVMDAANPGARDAVLTDGAKWSTSRPTPTAEDIPQRLAQVEQQTWVVSQIVMHEWLVGAIILTLALLAAMLASVSTVALSLTIRRSTLRQVSANLAEISEQLRQLRSGP